MSLFSGNFPPGFGLLVIISTCCMQKMGGGGGEQPNAAPAEAQWVSMVSMSSELNFGKNGQRKKLEVGH